MKSPVQLMFSQLALTCYWISFSLPSFLQSVSVALRNLILEVGKSTHQHGGLRELLNMLNVMKLTNAKRLKIK